MLRVFGYFSLGLLALFAMIAIYLWLGPREQIDPKPNFDSGVLGDDLDNYLAESEAKIGDVKDNSTKEILWAGSRGTKTEFVVVNLHGFSANKNEIRPIPERVAAALDANLYLTRMPGHGRPGSAMGPVTANDWMRELDEIMAIAARLGEKVILVGTSTGGTLATAALRNEDYAARISGLIYVAPNFKLVSPLAELGNMPGIRVWGDWVAGPERAWEPYSPAHGANWTTAYPTQSIVAMMRLMDYVDDTDFRSIVTPAFFVFNDGDTVVDSTYTRAVIEQWGGATKIYAMPPSEQNFPDQHVTMGDIMGPHNTDAVWSEIEDWLEQF